MRYSKRTSPSSVEFIREKRHDNLEQQSKGNATLHFHTRDVSSRFVCALWAHHSSAQYEKNT